MSGTLVVPLTKENGYFGVPKNRAIDVFAPYKDPIVEGQIDYKYGRNDVLWGIEYNPELFFKSHNKSFCAIGLVGNYSFGVISHGRFTVSNNKTTFHGAVIQNFSKLGVSLRLGLEK
jgi:hypothetical protein